MVADPESQPVLLNLLIKGVKGLEGIGDRRTLTLSGGGQCAVGTVNSWNFIINSIEKPGA